MSPPFEPDPKLKLVADAYAQDTVDFAAKHCGISLDWSDASIAHIESILDVFHQQAAEAQPPPEKVIAFAKMFGSYIGEVFRRNHGATWGLVTLDGARFPGLKIWSSGGVFWPWGKVQNRLTNGPEDNVWHYYQAIVADPTKQTQR